MYIDFHMHAFDDEIALKAIKKLEDICQSKAFTDGTVKGAVNLLNECNVGKGVLLPIATKPSQQKKLNDWAKAQESDFIIPFGTIHPEAPDMADELNRIKSMGMKGIKLHPDYQNFFVDEDRMISIYEKCAELNLIVVFHAGFDPLSADCIHATPQALRRVFKAVPDLTAVLGHLGGMNLWDDVKKYLCGIKGNVYFDTALIAGNINKKLCEDIINLHGADRVLLASDSPWHKVSGEINFIDSLNLTQEEKNCIYYKNAIKLLAD